MPELPARVSNSNQFGPLPPLFKCAAPDGVDGSNLLPGVINLTCDRFVLGTEVMRHVKGIDLLLVGAMGLELEMGC
ncbi:unnamed protein product [Sphenostylis stenocarpa]|uniref:Uncharacterized protein n=1 Tax=Sphenostylis stenocarpa TaxID=92480 RepID=A0AA86TDC1_9FABA|nr:unnamed protein product [Sphenostylis stenocarpa]